MFTKFNGYLIKQSYKNGAEKKMIWCVGKWRDALFHTGFYERVCMTKWLNFAYECLQSLSYGNKQNDVLESV